MSLTWEDIDVEGSKEERTPCECCGKWTIEVRGDLLKSNEWIAFYWVRFAQGHPESSPTIHCGTGDWSESAADDQRWLFGVEYNLEAKGFHLLDLRIDHEQALPNYTALNRDEILGTQFAQDAFAMIDAIWMKDPHLEELRI